jgi:hypothetical protein
MPTLHRWKVTGVIGIGLLGAPLMQLVPAPPAASPRPPVVDPPLLPLRRTPAQAALREAAFWWVQAVQLADDDCDEAREALHAWDPAAHFDLKTTRERELARDQEGYLRRSFAAAHRAAALARTAAERHRTEQSLVLLARTAGITSGAIFGRSTGSTAP